MNTSSSKKTPMKVTVVMMGFNLKAVLATGAQVFGYQQDTPIRRFDYFMEGTIHSDGANDAFEYSNAPWRGEDWVAEFGPSRSMSVGDVAIVQFNGETVGFVCQGCGWAEVRGDAIEATIEKLNACAGYHDRSVLADSLS